MLSRSGRWIVLVLFCACSGEPPAAPLVAPLEEPTFPSILAGELACGTLDVPAPVGIFTWNRYWSCGSDVTYHIATNMNEDQAGVFRTAASRWNEAMQPAQTGIPRLVESGSARLAITSSNPTSSNVSSGWSGAVLPQNPSLTPTGINFAQNNPTNPGPLLAIALNELARVYGLDDDLDSKGRVIGFTDHCALSTSPPQATTPCQHDIEFVKWIYGIRMKAPDTTKHIVTSVRLPWTQDTIAVGEDRLFTVSALGFARVHPDFCDECGAVAATNENSEITLVSVGTTPPFSLHPVSARTWRITGVHDGTGTIRVKYSSDVFERTDGVANDAARIQITVATPPAGPPSNLGANSVTHNSAVVTWTTGDPLASTIVEYRASGQTAWTITSTSPGATSRPTINLAPSTTYSVRAYHQRGGFDSDTVIATNLFQTTVAPPPDVSIVGNYTSATNRIKPNQTCRFIAFPSGGTYAWSRKNQGSTWKNAGTSREVVLKSGTVDFQLRVVVTVGGQSGSDSLSLDVASAGVVCDGY